MPALLAAHASTNTKARVVTVASSGAYLSGPLDFAAFVDNPKRRALGSKKLYFRSKLVSPVSSPYRPARLANIGEGECRRCSRACPAAWGQDSLSLTSSRLVRLLPTACFPAHPHNSQATSAPSYSGTRPRLRPGSPCVLANHRYRCSDVCQRAQEKLFLFPVAPYGALTQLFAGTSPEAEEYNGQVRLCRLAPPSSCSLSCLTLFVYAVYAAVGAPGHSTR